MPDDSKGTVTFAEALRSWSEDELQKAADDRQMGEQARAELARRKRPCSCFVAGSVPHDKWRQRLRECRRHQGSPL
jgi:hypothetical protein